MNSTILDRAISQSIFMLAIGGKTVYFTEFSEIFAEQ